MQNIITNTPIGRFIFCPFAVWQGNAERTVNLWQIMYFV
nr:MAG TPA: Protein of unknown function (DUF3641) [Caudoviricetes sp.]